MSKSGKHSAAKPVVRRRARKVAAATLGIVLAGGGAFAASNWLVGVNAGATGEGQSAAITPLTITAVAAPSAGNLLYPGANGDVTISINNPNSFPVTVTALTAPAATNAAAFSSSALTPATAVAGCTSSTSLVTWNWGASSHTLGTPMTVAGNNGNLVVTLTNAATMGALSPAACASSYFQMPAFTAVAASGGAATATTSPATTS